MIKTQTLVLDRLERETRRALRRHEDGYADHLRSLWSETALDIQAIITQEYHRDFGGGTWDIVQTNRHGTLVRIMHRARQRLAAFRVAYSDRMRRALEQVYLEETLRGLWMLDQVTPPTRRPQFPTRRTREADEPKAPRDYSAGWDDTLEEWIRVYENTLETNLRLEALHEGSISDAADEAKATTIGNSDPVVKFASLFTNEALQTQAEARADLFASNADVADVEIFMTMEDGRVCPICDKYDGKPYEDVPDEIPVHFYCRCYTRIVPKVWAQMLASGDPDERELALQMDDRGLVPDSMAIRGPGGSLIGYAFVKFDDWLTGRGADFYGSSIAGRMVTQ